jgi:hypothetical protein
LERVPATTLVGAPLCQQIFHALSLSRVFFLTDIKEADPVVLHIYVKVLECETMQNANTTSSCRPKSPWTSSRASSDHCLGCCFVMVEYIFVATLGAHVPMYFLRSRCRKHGEQGQKIALSHPSGTCWFSQTIPNRAG